MRILQVANQRWRNYGHNRVHWPQKLFSGLIKNDHNVRVFSDRDIAAFEAPFGIRALGKAKANLRLIQVADAFQPELVLIGHCDLIENATIEKIRQIVRGVVITVCNNDPVFVPENVEKIKERSKVADTIFVSTGERELAMFKGSRARLKFMPNAVDVSIECHDATLRSEFDSDLIFCSKEEKHSNRKELLDFLTQNLPNEIKFFTPGHYGTKNLWGNDYDSALSKTKMGLNLNRQEGFYLYSSARMAQLVGNGLLTFVHEGSGFKDLFPPESLVYFADQRELLGKIKHFHHENDERIHWASKARKFIHQEMNETLHARYIVEASMGAEYSYPYVWEK